MEELIAAGTHQVAELVALVCHSVRSKSSKRLYRSAIREFLVWCSRTAQPAFNKAAVQKYRAELEARALAPATVNVYLAAIRKLAAEAADNGLLTPDIAAGILRVKGSRRQGVRTGNWLTKVQAERLLQAPDTRELRGLRDRALLAVLLGTGLRRREAAELTFEKIQQRDGRWIKSNSRWDMLRSRPPNAIWVSGRTSWTPPATIWGFASQQIQFGNRHHPRLLESLGSLNLREGLARSSNPARLRELTAS